MAPTGNGRSRAESPGARPLSERHLQEKSETDTFAPLKKNLVGPEKVSIQSSQTKSPEKNASAVETKSRYARVRSTICNKKIVLSLVSSLCLVSAIGAWVLLWKPDLSTTAIIKNFEGVDQWFAQKPSSWVISYAAVGVVILCVCAFIGTIIRFRKSLAKKLLSPFAKKQA